MLANFLPLCIPSGEQAFCLSYLALHTQGVNRTADNRINIDRLGGTGQSRSGRSCSPKPASPQLPKDAVGIQTTPATGPQLSASPARWPNKSIGVTSKE